MKKQLIGLTAFLAAANQASADYKTPSDEDIMEIAVDLVIHYDVAVVAGTSNPEYIASRQEYLFKDLKINLTEENCSESIDLYTCAIDLICTEKMGLNNLHPDLLPCD